MSVRIFAFALVVGSTLATSSAVAPAAPLDHTPLTVSVAPVHTTDDAFYILRDFGVVGTPTSISATLTSTCARLDGTVDTAHAVWTDLSHTFGDNSGSVLAEAVDAYCPAQIASVKTMMQEVAR